MPLDLVVPSLERVKMLSTSTASSVHPIHSLIEPLLLTAATITNKYQVELPEILSNGGGAGEMEETMMWYAITHEKEGNVIPNADEVDIWMNNQWRITYLDRMERREHVAFVLL